MPRIGMPDQACRSIDVVDSSGRKVRYQPDRHGSVQVDNPAHARQMLTEAECFVADGHLVRTGGFTCTGCGFRAFFTTCSRCGGSCTKETS